MSLLKKYNENKNGDWVKITKMKIYDDPMYLLEWNNKNESSYDENFYTYYNHALVDFDWVVKTKLN